MKKSFLLLAAAMMFVACNKKQETPQAEHQNPFLTDYTTEYEVPPFEDILAEDYIPAIEAGIKQQNEEIEAIVNNQEPATFENTIDALDMSGDILSKVALVLYNVTESDATEELQKVMEQAIPMLTEHNDNIYMRADLYARVKAVYDDKENHPEYTTEQLMVLEKINRAFVRNGVGLDEAGQARMREINKELATLENKFGDNLLAETNAFQLVLETEEELAGLPKAVRDAAALLATENGMEGKYLFTLQKPSWIPFMQYSARRDLREKMFKAYANRGNNGGEHDNNQVVLDIIRLRIEKAKLLGFDTPANFILDETMAKNQTTVDKFLDGIFKPAVAKAKVEREELQKMIDKENGGFKLEPWDWDYYTEKLRQEKYALNEDDIKPYFQMEKVREGMFNLAATLYDLKFEKLENMPKFNKEAEVFKVSSSVDGSLIGILYTDYYPRASKRAGAWMTNFREQSNLNGKEIRPVIVNIGNFTKPTAESPSLLSLDDVETMFHEFGHALHGLLTQCHYKTVSGTNVARDFVELFSQINENWAFEPEILKTYATHYQTGEVIPDSLIEKIQRVSTFNQGFITTELCAAAILDMRWHELTSVDGIDVQKFEADVMKAAGLIDEIIPRYRTTYFNHAFKGGYSAGYYGYLWAEVLDKDAFEMFRKNGLLDKETALAFKHKMIEKGGSDEPMKLFIDFRGAEPNSDAMLRGRGLK
ncbi:MAG: M3 family metallopeptidase [Bacteroidales bacterium]|nr:M3 family metallopeptidase [Bacteroidales bacterium]